MDILKKITEPIKEELISFEKLLYQTVSTSYDAANEIIVNKIDLNGKRMRPILTLLVAKLLGQVKENHLVGAVILELTHNASLVHDDIIDQAEIRRGKPTLNSIIGAKEAVLMGDFLLAGAIEVGVEKGHYKAIQIASRTFKQLVEGELQQALKAQLLDSNKEDYFKIINLKTAYLLASSSEVGACDFGLSEKQIADFYLFGELIGQAYQIKDDILDYVGNDSGKRLFNDIKERKITLPLLLAFEEKGGRAEIIEMLKVAADDKNALDKIVNFVMQSGAIENCYKEVEKLKNRALEILSNYPDNDAKKALELYCDFVTNRNY